MPQPAGHPNKSQGHMRWDGLPRCFTGAWSAHHRAGPQGRRCWGQREVRANLAPSGCLIFPPAQALATQLPDPPSPDPRDGNISAPFPPNAASLQGPAVLQNPSSHPFQLLPSFGTPLSLLFPPNTPSPTLIAGTPVSYPLPGQLCTHPPWKPSPSHGLSLGLSPASPIWPGTLYRQERSEV